MRTILNYRILPAFGARPLPRNDSAALAAWTEAIGVWKADLVAEGLRARTINGYLTKVSKIITTRSTSSCSTATRCTGAPVPGVHRCFATWRWTRWTCG
jgi:hypothetical protein